jgi:creatinine amidohydrolase
MQNIENLLKEPAQILNPAQNKYLLANNNYQEVSEYLEKQQNIILPIGSTEQHGADGLLGVDHITATAIAYSLAQHKQILCAPPLNYGMAMHHLDFKGTMALKPITYINVISDLIASLKDHGFKEIIVINGHGGNKGPFLNALAQNKNDFADLDFKFFNWWVMPKLEKEIIKKEFAEKEGYHATPTEISLTMFVCPEMMSVPESYKCPQKEVGSENCSWVIPKKFKELYPDGVMRADYSLATKDIGKKVLEFAVQEIAALI